MKMNLSKNLAKLSALALTICFAAGIGAPVASYAQTSKEKARQRDKNLMRNVGIGAGAVAVHEAVKGRTTNALIAGAGAALAGKKYEDARKAQRRENGTYKVYRYRNGKKIGYYQYVNNRRTGYYRI